MTLASWSRVLPFAVFIGFIGLQQGVDRACRGERHRHGAASGVERLDVHTIAAGRPAEPIIAEPVPPDALRTLAGGPDELADDGAGIPEGLVRVVTGGGSTGRALVESGVDRLVFTGSTAVGKKIMATAAETLTPVTLELGGKDAAIVLEDADLDRAASGAAYAAFFNAGQSCCGIERVYVHRDVYDPFLEAFAAEANALVLGDPREPAVTMGPLATAHQLRDAVEGVARLRQDAELAHGDGERSDGVGSAEGRGYFFGPVLLRAADATAATTIHHHEVFGPVASLMAYDGSARQAAELEPELQEKLEALGYVE